MENPKRKTGTVKKLVITLLSLILVLVILLGAYASIFVFGLFENDTLPLDFSRIPYKTDTSLFIREFGDMVNIKGVYSKQDIIGDKEIGPSTVYIRAFVTTDERSTERLFEEYEFKKADSSDLSFEEGLDPAITGFSEFDWYYSSSLVDKNIWWGYADIFVDITNNVIFIRYESD